MGEARVVGRESEVAAALRALADPSCDGVLLVADEPGAGATTVLDAILDRLAAEGRPANRIVASRGASASPYAALAHVLPMPLPPVGSDIEALAVFDSIRERVASLGGGAKRYVTAVDDVRWLDESSLALLSTLLAGKLATVVATIRAGDPVPEAVAAVERSCAIRRIPIRRLGRDDAEECIADLLPGAVDGTLAHELFVTSRGNPLFLREVIAGGVAAGTINLEEDVWSLSGRLVPTPRLTTILDADLDGIATPERRVLELLAICEPVDIRALERLDLGDAAVALDDRGLVGSEEGTTTVHVRLVQPLLAALLRARMSPLRRRAHLRDAVQALSPYASPGDQLRLAGWKLDAGIEVPTAELLAAAQQARAVHDVEAVHRLATAALRDAPSGEARVLQAEALQSLGRFDAAEASLAAAERVASDDRARLAAALVRQGILLWRGVEASATRPVLEAARAGLTHPASRDLVVAGMATMEAVAGRAAACIELIELLESGSELAETAMAFPVAMAEARLGRPARAAEVARRARVRAGEAAGAYGVGHMATLTFAEGVALTECGRFEEAEGVLRAAYREVVDRRIPQYQAWTTSRLARLALLRGRPQDARRWFVECRAVSRRIGFEPGERAAVIGLIVCAGMSGELDRVAVLGREVGERWGAPDPIWPEGPAAAAWLAVVTRDGDPGERLVTAACDAVACGEYTAASEFAAEAIRFGQTTVPEELLAAIECVEGALARARAALVRGTCYADVVALESAERSFASLGAPLVAAEAAVQLSRLCLRLGRARQAAAAAVRSDGYRAHNPGASSPLLARPAATAALSEREAEIADLAASGLASKEIAVRLDLSVRTVSNHLQNVYTKLGVSGRDQLRDVLGVRTA